jgi:PTH1 family peptidyl-tRNA hydrolase
LRAVLGIGNPGLQYAGTRHNIGFSILDYFASKWKLSFSPSKKDYYSAGGTIDASRFLFVKPTTYVNLSGIAAKQIVDEYGINLEDLLIVCDDINLNLGKIRLRKSGGDGGHNGIQSLIYHFESDQFPRLRFGVGSDFKDGLMSDYVLEKFNDDEAKIIEPQIKFASEIIENFVIGGTKQMLEYFSIQSNKFNSNTNIKNLGN